MSQSVAGRVMPMIVVGAVDAIRNFYVDTLGFAHVMGMEGGMSRRDGAEFAVLSEQGGRFHGGA